MITSKTIPAMAPPTSPARTHVLVAVVTPLCRSDLLSCRRGSHVANVRLNAQPTFATWLTHTVAIIVG